MINITMIICLSAIAIALIIANAKEKIEEKRINMIQEEQEKSRKQRKELLARLDKEWKEFEKNILKIEKNGGKNERNK